MSYGQGELRHGGTGQGYRPTPLSPCNLCTPVQERGGTGQGCSRAGHCCRRCGCFGTKGRGLAVELWQLPLGGEAAHCVGQGEVRLLELGLRGGGLATLQDPSPPPRRLSTLLKGVALDVSRGHIQIVEVSLTGEASASIRKVCGLTPGACRAVVPQLTRLAAAGPQARLLRVRHQAQVGGVAPQLGRRRDGDGRRVCGHR